jgi:hypothetical protein
VIVKVGGRFHKQQINKSVEEIGYHAGRLFKMKMIFAAKEGNANNRAMKIVATFLSFIYDWILQCNTTDGQCSPLSMVNLVGITQRVFRLV